MSQLELKSPCYIGTKKSVLDDIDGKTDDAWHDKMKSILPEYITNPKARKPKTLKTLVLDKLKGGPGSGHFGHVGRPGKVGGSGKGKYRADSLGISNDTSYRKGALQEKLNDIYRVYGQTPLTDFRLVIDKNGVIGVEAKRPKYKLTQEEVEENDLFWANDKKNETMSLAVVFNHYGEPRIRIIDYNGDGSGYAMLNQTHINMLRELEDSVKFENPLTSNGNDLVKKDNLFAGLFFKAVSQQDSDYVMNNLVHLNDEYKKIGEAYFDTYENIKKNADISKLFTNDPSSPMATLSIPKLSNLDLDALATDTLIKAGVKHFNPALRKSATEFIENSLKENAELLSNTVKAEDFGKKLGYKDRYDLTEQEIVNAKKNIMHAISAQSGISEEGVNALVKQWAYTSNDSHIRSLQIQAVAAEMFGVPLSDWQKKKYATQKEIETRFKKALAKTMKEVDLKAQLLPDSSSKLANAIAIRDKVLDTLRENLKLDFHGAEVDAIVNYSDADIGLRDIWDDYDGLKAMVSVNYGPTTGLSQHGIIKTIYDRLYSPEAPSLSPSGKTYFQLKKSDATNFLSTMYKNTQRHLAKLGYKPDQYIKLFRGVTQKTVKNLTGAQYGIADYFRNTLESWSTNEDTASTFGYTLTRRVRVKDIIATAFTGFGCLNESEIVVLGAQPENKLPYTNVVGGY